MAFGDRIREVKRHIARLMPSCAAWYMEINPDAMVIHWLVEEWVYRAVIWNNIDIADIASEAVCRIQAEMSGKALDFIVK